MATACSFLSEDQFQCSICLDVFTEPVSIPCGHNFCKSCLTRHWEGKEQCQCPLCNAKFNKGLKLCVNTAFREVVENFKEHNIIANNSPVKPGQVPCDCCLGNKFKASKTCLVCLASYCETHLEPHLRVPALKRHKLTNPVHNLEDQICKKHNRMLELFCRNDQTCVCILCTEHSSHDMVPLEEAYVDKRVHMGKKKTEVQEMKHKRGKRAQKTKVTVQTKRKGKYEVMAKNVGTNQMQASLSHQFNRHGYYPGNREFPEGRFYREVQAEENTGGLDIEELMRGMRTFILNPRNENWVIRLGTDTNCNALHEVPVHLFLIRKPERVVVFVDYDAGLVSFVDADTATLVYFFTGCKFNESMYLFYSHSPTKKNSWGKKLQMGVQKIKEWSQLPDTKFCLLCIVFVFVLVVCISIAVSEHVLNHERK